MSVTPPAARHKVNIIGHQNPDTDSICSAIGYAWLKTPWAAPPTKPAAPASSTAKPPLCWTISGWSPRGCAPM